MQGLTYFLQFGVAPPQARCRLLGEPGRAELRNPGWGVILQIGSGAVLAQEFDTNAEADRCLSSPKRAHARQIVRKKRAAPWARLFVHKRCD